jgi:hypothetical protein
VFNGSRFRSEIAPRISDFVLSVGEANRASRRPPSIRVSRTGAVLHTV